MLAGVRASDKATGCSAANGSVGTSDQGPACDPGSLTPEVDPCPRIVVSAVVAVGVLWAASTAASDGGGVVRRASGVEWRTLDGSANDLAHPNWGRSGTPYVRVANPAYADGVAAMAAGPSPRYISNRVFNDTGQNVFSEHRLSQWAWIWGQFVDHTIGLRDPRPGEQAALPFDTNDPLERFRDDRGATASPARSRRRDGDRSGDTARAGQHASAATSTPSACTAARATGSKGGARSRSTATCPTTARPFSSRPATCRARQPAATRGPRRRWSP